MTQWIFGVNLGKIGWKPWGVGHIQEQRTWPPGGQIGKYRSPPQNWLASMECTVWIWKRSGVNSVQTRNKHIWVPSGHQWNPRALKINRCLDLGPTHICCGYEEMGLKTLVSGLHARKTLLAPWCCRHENSCSSCSPRRVEIDRDYLNFQCH